MRHLAKAFPLFLAAALLLAIGSCTKVDPVGVFDANEPKAASPTITGMSPAGNAFAGMDTIIITGTNFSSVLADNIVYFNAEPATLLSTSPTQIALKPPLVTIDSIGVRVSVRGAVSFSNTYQYGLVAGAKTFGDLTSTELSASLTTDAAGNLYSMTKSAMLKFTTAGVRTTYAPGISGVLLWTGIKMGPGGYIYAARNVRALYRFEPGGGAAPAIWLSSFPTGVYLADLDFDKDGNVWAGGNNANIYKVDPAKTITPFPFAGNIHSIRVYNDYLYFAAKVDAAEKIWRAPITAGALGTPEVYFDFEAVYPGKVPLAITFSSDGVLYIGTDTENGLLIVTPDKAVTAPFGTYKALFGTGLGFLAWGSTNDLYASTSNGALLRFTVRGKTSAPYFGSTL